jgi:hypothetical protein
MPKKCTGYKDIIIIVIYSLRFMIKADIRKINDEETIIPVRIRDFLQNTNFFVLHMKWTRLEARPMHCTYANII